MGAYRLKIIAGPHRGGELLLPESGELLIGSDDACDLVFSDPALAGRHARLLLDGGDIRLIPLEGAVRAGEIPLPAEGESVVDFRVYSLGETRLSLGPDQGEWPAAAPVEEGRDPSPARASVVAEPPGPETGLKRPRPGRWRKAALAALGLTLALSLARLHWPADSWTVFQTQLAQAGFGGLTLDRGPQGEMVLKGWLDSEPQVDRLKEMTRAFRPEAVVEVGSLRALAADLSARAKALGYTLLFTPERGGRLRVRGYAFSAGAAADMRRTLEPQLGSFAGDEWEIKTWADLAEILPAVAAARQLSFLRFEPQEARVAVWGLEQVPGETWAAFQEEIRDILGLPLVFVRPRPPAEKTRPVPSAPPLPPLRAAAALAPPGPGSPLCQGLTRDPAGRNSLGQAGDGAGYKEGALLPGGVRVVSVLPQGVFLEREGLMHYCPW